MASDPDDITRAVLAIALWLTFICSLATLLMRGVPAGNGETVASMLTTLGSMVALVTNYYFKKRS